MFFRRVLPVPPGGEGWRVRTRCGWRGGCGRGRRCSRRCVDITSLVQPLPGQQGATWTYSYSTGTTTGTDPNGHAAVFHFDASGRQTSAVDPLGHTKSQTWTNNNNINTITNALSQSSTFGYDTLNNLTSSQLPTGATTTLGYDRANGAHGIAPLLAKREGAPTLSNATRTNPGCVADAE